MPIIFYVDLKYYLLGVKIFNKQKYLPQFYPKHFESQQVSSGGNNAINFFYSLSPGVWQSFVTIRSSNHLMRIISTYVDNTKKSEIS